MERTPATMNDTPRDLPTHDESARTTLAAAFSPHARTAYFKHYHRGPLSRPAVEAVRQVLQEAHAGGARHLEAWNARIEATRRNLAALLGTDPARASHTLAFFPNTTTALTTVARGLSLKPGVGVVLSDGEYPANVYPWLALQETHGVRVGYARHEAGRLTPAAIECALDELEALGARPHVVSLSQVGYLTGFRLDLAAVAHLCRRRGVTFVLDVVQSVPVVPLVLDAEPGPDFVAGDGRKWLGAPEGAAFLWGRGDRLGRLVPLAVGAGSVAHGDLGRFELALHADARRHEGGARASLPIIALGASVALWLDYGGERAAADVKNVVALAHEAVDNPGAGVSHRAFESRERAGIVSFAVPAPTLAARRSRAARAGLTLGFTPPHAPHSRAGPGPGVRDPKSAHVVFAPHAYTEPEAFARALALVLPECFGGRPIDEATDG